MTITIETLDRLGEVRDRLEIHALTVEGVGAKFDCHDEGVGIANVLTKEADETAVGNRRDKLCEELCAAMAPPKTQPNIVESFHH